MKIKFYKLVIKFFIKNWMQHANINQLLMEGLQLSITQNEAGSVIILSF